MERQHEQIRDRRELTVGATPVYGIAVPARQHPKPQTLMQIRNQNTNPDNHTIICPKDKILRPHITEPGYPYSDRDGH